VQAYGVSATSIAAVCATVSLSVQQVLSVLTQQVGSSTGGFYPLGFAD
jgi:hypothetical protein